MIFHKVEILTLFFLQSEGQAEVSGGGNSYKKCNFYEDFSVFPSETTRGAGVAVALLVM